MPSPNLKISLGIWASRGSISWDNFLLFASFYEIPLPTYDVQEPYLPLLLSMIEEQLEEVGPEHTRYIWRAQQAYRVIQLVYTRKEQELILAARQKEKISRLQG